MTMFLVVRLRSLELKTVLVPGNVLKRLHRWPLIGR